MADTHEDNERLRRIEDTVSTLQADVGTLQADVSTLQANVQNLQTNMQNLQLDVRELKSDMKEVRSSLAKIEGALPHFATKEEVEQAKHEATKGKYGLVVSGLAFLLSLGAIASRWLVE